MRPLSHATSFPTQDGFRLHERPHLRPHNHSHTSHHHTSSHRRNTPLRTTNLLRNLPHNHSRLHTKVRSRSHLLHGIHVIRFQVASSSVSLLRCLLGLAVLLVQRVQAKLP